MKTCFNCHQIKELNLFTKNKSGRDGYSNQCKECRNKKHRSLNFIPGNIQHKKCSKCKEFKLVKEFTLRKRSNDGYMNSCKLCESIKLKKYYLDNKDRLKKQCNKYYYDLKEDSIKFELHKETRRKRQNERLRTDSLFKVKKNLRNRLWYALKNTEWKNRTHFRTYIGLDNHQDLVTYIEKQFTEGMSWDNYGEWEIDHIIPLASATTEEELYKLCHYTNLQPLWWKDNVIKADK